MAPRPARTPKKSARVFGGRLALLDDQRVRDWYEDKAKNRKLSATTNVRKLSFLLEKVSLSLDEIEAMATNNPNELRRRLNRYATEAKEAGRLDSYLGKLFTGLRAYLHFRRIKFDEYPELESTTGESIANEKVPSQEHLGLVLERLSPRGRVIALLLAHAGVRPQVIGAYEGARGLVLSDLPDLALSPTIAFEKVPFVIRGRAKLSKTGKSWTTFGTRQLSTSIVSYLNERQERGEVLGPESPLVTHNEVRGAALRSRKNSGVQYGFLTTTHVVLEVANALHALAPEGTRARPYSLRGFFSTALLRAGVDREFREALMGHDTGIAGAYNVGKPWSDDLLERARDEYLSAIPYLETNATPEGDVKRELVQSLIRSIEEAAKRKSGADAGMTAEELVAALTQTLTRNVGEPNGKSIALVPSGSPIPPATRQGEQRVVETDITPHYLDAGWTFRSPLNGTQAVVEWTSAPPATG